MAKKRISKSTRGVYDAIIRPAVSVHTIQDHLSRDRIESMGAIIKTWKFFFP